VRTPEHAIERELAVTNPVEVWDPPIRMVLGNKLLLLSHDR
jgi:hypothetical protein